MAQFKIHGYEQALGRLSFDTSGANHRAAVGSLGLPQDNRFNRFMPLETWQLVAPDELPPNCRVDPTSDTEQ